MMTGFLLSWFGIVDDILLDAGGSVFVGTSSDLSSKSVTLLSTARLMQLFLIQKEPGSLFAWRAKLEPCTFIHGFTEKFMR